MSSSERWQRVERLFHSALALAAHERRAFLEAECRTDPTLLEEVDALIRAESGAASTSYEQLAPFAAAAWAGVSSGPDAAQGSSDRDLAGVLIAHYEIQKRRRRRHGRGVPRA
jgi:hypothetical protein